MGLILICGAILGSAVIVGNAIRTRNQPQSPTVETVQYAPPNLIEKVGRTLLVLIWLTSAFTALGSFLLFLYRGYQSTSGIHVRDGDLFGPMFLAFICTIVAVGGYFMYREERATVKDAQEQPSG